MSRVPTVANGCISMGSIDACEDRTAATQRRQAVAETNRGLITLTQRLDTVSQRANRRRRSRAIEFSAAAHIGPS